MQNLCQRIALMTVLVASSVSAFAIPFNSFDPRSMAMGGVGVAIGDPSTAPFFNPALLTAGDRRKKFAFEFPIIGMRLYDPGSLNSNVSNMADDAKLLTNAITPLTDNAAALTASTTTLATNITALAAITLDTTTLGTTATKLATVQTNLSSVSSNMTTISTNVTTVQTNIDRINQLLISMSSQPLQTELGIATVLSKPNRNWGFALYASSWAAIGATLEYNDSPTVSNISGAIGTAATALSGSATAISSTSATQIALSAAVTAVNKANTSCAIAVDTTCTTDLAAAVTALSTASTALSTASTTLTTNATTVSNQTTTVGNNKTLLSKFHVRGVLISESGISMSHRFVINDQTLSLGITPKIMYLQLYDASLSATAGSLDGATGNDYVAKYSNLNVDVGLTKNFNNGFRTGIVAKNAISHTYDFKNALTPGDTPVANGAQFRIRPLVRVGIAYEIPLFIISADADLTKNDPVGLENYSQYVGLGMEVGITNWTRLRVGYRNDLLDKLRRNTVSAGLGISPRLPFFKPHFDLAITSSPSLLREGFENVNEIGFSFRFGVNF